MTRRVKVTGDVCKLPFPLECLKTECDPECSYQTPRWVEVDSSEEKASIESKGERTP